MDAFRLLTKVFAPCPIHGQRCHIIGPPDLTRKQARRIARARLKRESRRDFEKSTSP